jgi:hypothetical protein
MFHRALALVATAVLAGSASAFTIYSTSFEAAEGYTFGNLNDQREWAARPLAAHGYSVTGARSSDGDWSVVQQFTTTGAFSSSRRMFPEFTPGNYGYPALLARVDLYMEQGTTGSLFGLDFWSGGARVGSMVVNSPGSVFIFNQTTNQWVSGTHAGVQPGQWLTLELQANFQDNSIRGWINGQGHNVVGNFTSTSITHVELLTLRETSFDTNPAYFDTFVVQAVPEPGTLAALGLGALAFIRSRRKSA